MHASQFSQQKLDWGSGRYVRFGGGTRRARVHLSACPKACSSKGRILHLPLPRAWCALVILPRIVLWRGPAISAGPNRIFPTARTCSRAGRHRSPMCHSRRFLSLHDPGLRVSGTWFLQHGQQYNPGGRAERPRPPCRPASCGAGSARNTVYRIYQAGHVPRERAFSLGAIIATACQKAAHDHLPFKD